jgi:hypothetical protein
MYGWEQHMGRQPCSYFISNFIFIFYVFSSTKIREQEGRTGSEGGVIWDQWEEEVAGKG